jgi:cyclopropane-fatty-acyl-phospholipid synthase
VFNPVSFWFCYDGVGQLKCLVAEVNNTFGERHTYILNQPLPCSAPFVARFRVPKAFYVSPFNPIEGDYEFRVADLADRLDIRLRIFDHDKPIFNTWLRGHGAGLTRRSLWRILTSYPLTAWLTVPRIHWEAAVLFFKKNLPIVYKPRPSDPFTLRAEPPGALHRTAVRLVKSFLERAQVGQLRLDLPNGQVWTLGQPEQPAQGAAEIRVLNWDFFVRLVWDGDVALGDGVVAGEWESEDLTAVVRFFVDNREQLDDRQLWFTRYLARGWGWLRQRLRANSLSGSRRNIQAHYDLGNQLYRRFLDSTMSYSCAYFASPDHDLEQAQRAKISMLLDKARLNAECHVLEIGCGWGSLAIEAVRRSGCRVTGITLSQQQLEWARQRVEEAGLSDRIDLRLCDYRQIEGRYDRILSCEMLEAVGHEHLGLYFSSLERVLRPEGLVVLQVITVPDFSYEEYRCSQDWIQKEIFPGALCPSLSALVLAAKENSRLVVEHLENIGPHYARTLREWRGSLARIAQPGV